MSRWTLPGAVLLVCVCAAPVDAATHWGRSVRDWIADTDGRTKKRPYANERVAIRALQAMAPKSGTAYGALVKLLGAKEKRKGKSKGSARLLVREAAQRALISLGAPSAARVLPVLKHSDPRVRRRALKVLAHVGAGNSKVTEALVKLRDTPDHEGDRALVLATLVRFQHDVAGNRESLMRELNSENAGRRFRAASVLPLAGQSMRGALPRLQEMQKAVYEEYLASADEPGETVLKEAARYISFGRAMDLLGVMAFFSPAEEADALLARLAKHLQGAGRNYGLTSAYLAAGPVAFPHLRRLLADDAKPIREFAARTLWEAGPGAIPTLREALSDETVVEAVLDGSYGGDVAPLTSELVTLARTSKAGEQAVRALSRMGPEALPELLELLRTAGLDDGVRRGVGYGLSEACPLAITELVAMLKEEAKRKNRNVALLKRVCDALLSVHLGRKDQRKLLRKALPTLKKLSKEVIESGEGGTFWIELSSLVHTIESRR